jgi:ComF family protein
MSTEGPPARHPDAASAGASHAARPSPWTRSPRVAWPGLCEVCRRWTSGAWCRECESRFAAPVARCGRCALAVAPAAAGSPCGECLRDPPPFALAVCAFDYRFPWDRLIAAFKFDARVGLARPLAASLADAVASTRAQAASPPWPALVLPVPLGPARLRERGYNQAWELARRDARRLALPARADVLVRLGDAPRQTGLARSERLRNLRDAFGVDPKARPLVAGLAVALVDDVVTTGATARAASAALLAAGAARVELWALARTPDPRVG